MWSRAWSKGGRNCLCYIIHARPCCTGLAFVPTTSIPSSFRRVHAHRRPDISRAADGTSSNAAAAAAPATAIAHAAQSSLDPDPPGIRVARHAGLARRHERSTSPPSHHPTSSCPPRASASGKRLAGVGLHLPQSLPSPSTRPTTGPWRPSSAPGDSPEVTWSPTLPAPPRLLGELARLSSIHTALMHICRLGATALHRPPLLPPRYCHQSIHHRATRLDLTARCGERRA